MVVLCCVIFRLIICVIYALFAFNCIVRRRIMGESIDAGIFLCYVKLRLEMTVKVKNDDDD